MNEATIWNFLKSNGLNDYGAAGLMGNLFAESGLKPNNLQNSYESALNMNDNAYVSAVDSGRYTNFTNDRAGFGLAQWTYPSRKQALLTFCKAAGASIGDLEAQLKFLLKELSESFPAVLKVLKSATSVREASNAVLLKFERPANQSQGVQDKRCSFGQGYYDKYAQKGVAENKMSISPLVTYTGLTFNCNSPRNHVIDRLTIHCFVGQVNAKRGCEVFQNSTASSCNYVVGFDGSIGLSVDEKNRSWCTSSKENDHRAVTIECASDNFHPYAVTDKAYAALLDLVTDICQRNGKTKLVWFGNKEKALAYTPKNDEMVMTVHRWYTNKACPGDWLYQRHNVIMDEVNSRLANANRGTKNNESEVLEMNITKDELKAMIRETVVEVYNELNPLYEDIKDVPGYWKGTAQKLLDAEAVNGGTSKEVCATDLNLRRETLKAAIIASLYHDYEESEGAERE